MASIRGWTSMSPRGCRAQVKRRSRNAPHARIPHASSRVRRASRSNDPDPRTWPDYDLLLRVTEHRLARADAVSPLLETQGDARPIAFACRVLNARFASLRTRVSARADPDAPASCGW